MRKVSLTTFFIATGTSETVQKKKKKIYKQTVDLVTNI